LGRSHFGVFRLAGVTLGRGWGRAAQGGFCSWRSSDRPLFCFGERKKKEGGNEKLLASRSRSLEPRAFHLGGIPAARNKNGTIQVSRRGTKRTRQGRRGKKVAKSGKNLPTPEEVGGVRKGGTRTDQLRTLRIAKREKLSTRGKLKRTQGGIDG